MSENLEEVVDNALEVAQGFVGLGQFDEARECYESLRELGEISSSDLYLKKLAEAQEKVGYFH